MKGQGHNALSGKFHPGGKAQRDFRSFKLSFLDDF